MSSDRRKTDKSPKKLSMSKSLPASSKIKTKKKVTSFDWTDEAIEEVANSDNVVPIDELEETMETKIARVQERKREAEDRKARLKITMKSRK